MYGSIRHTTCITVLLFLCLYAISPTCLSVHMEHGNSACSQQQHSTTLSTGIIWIKIMLSVITAVDPDDTNNDGVQECRTVLMSKKRGVLREQTHMISLCATVNAFPAILENDTPKFDIYRFAKKRQSKETIGHYRLNSGLSPPVVS